MITMDSFKFKSTAKNPQSDDIAAKTQDITQNIVPPRPDDAPSDLTDKKMDAFVQMFAPTPGIEGTDIGSGG